MIEFLTSIGVFGWVLIGLALVCLIWVPRFWRGAGKSGVEQKPPVGQPPDYRGPPGGGAV